MNKIEMVMRAYVQHYNEKLYWRRRLYVENFSGGGLGAKLLASWYLFYIKKSDAFNNASLGTHLGSSAHFESIPSFPHGLYGIIISHRAVFGKNCTIYHQVTVGSGTAIIGDNVIIGAGAKIIGNVIIGNNVKIGANAVVTHDIPDNATVVPAEMRIIDHNTGFNDEENDK